MRPRTGAENEMKESGVMTPEERAAIARRTTWTAGELAAYREGLGNFAGAQRTITRLRGIVQLQARHIAKLEAAARAEEA